MAKFDFNNRPEFIKSVSKMFHDDDQKVGEITANLIEMVEGMSARDVMCALSFLSAYIIDCNDDKRGALQELVEVVTKLVNFDKPAFEGEDNSSPFIQ